MRPRAFGLLVLAVALSTLLLQLRFQDGVSLSLQSALAAVSPVASAAARPAGPPAAAPPVGPLATAPPVAMPAATPPVTTPTTAPPVDPAPGRSGLCGAVGELFPKKPVGEKQLVAITKKLRKAWPDAMREEPHYPSLADLTKVLYFDVPVYDGVPNVDMSWAEAYTSTAWTESKAIAASMERLLGRPPLFMLEVGTFIGSGAVHGWGPLMQRHGGMVLCIDTWLGDINMRLGSKFQPFMQTRNGFPQLGQKFLQRVVRYNLTRTVLPMSLPSIVAARLLALMPWTVDAAYIDSAHEKGETIVELHLYYQLLRPGGLLMGDDYDVFPAVKQDVNLFAACNNLSVLLPAPNTWMLRKPGGMAPPPARAFPPGEDVCAASGLWEKPWATTSARAAELPCPQPPAREAWATLLSAGVVPRYELAAVNNYMVAILVLLRSVRQFEKCAHRPFLVLHEGNNSRHEGRVLQKLQEAGMVPTPLPPIEPPYPSAKKELRIGWLKLRVWSMTEWDRIVILDADMVLTGSLEPLFLRGVARAPTLVVGPMPVCSSKRLFNIGVMSVGPSASAFQAMLRELHAFDGREDKPDDQDQGWLDMFFQSRGSFAGFAGGPAEGPWPCAGADSSHSLAWCLALPSYNVFAQQSAQDASWRERLRNICMKDELRVLHWPGRQKPWCLPPKNRTPFERYWWRQAEPVLAEYGLNLTAGMPGQCGGKGLPPKRRAQLTDFLKAQTRCCDSLGAGAC